MIVPKRAALLLDRIMVALHHALEDDEKGAKRIDEVYRNGRYLVSPKFETQKFDRSRTKYITSNSGKNNIKYNTFRNKN